jgi:hypothetical protein
MKGRGKIVHSRPVARIVRPFRLIAPARAKADIDTTPQIRLFVKLKLSWCARAGNRAGLCFVRCVSRRTRVYTARASRVLPPGLCSPLDIRCYLRWVAAHVFVFEREIPRPCKFRCYLQRALLILQVNFGASGLSKEHVPSGARHAKLPSAARLQVRVGQNLAGSFHPVRQPYPAPRRPGRAGRCQGRGVPMPSDYCWVAR